MRTSTPFTERSREMIAVEDEGRSTRAWLQAFLAGLAGLVGLVAALPAFLLALPLWFTSFLTHRLAAFLEPEITPWSDLLKFDSALGWKVKPNVRAWAHNWNGDAFRLSTDQWGFRGPGALEDTDMFVFGDSFAFGHAVDDSDFFGCLAGGLSIKGIGAPAYSMVHPLLWMERLAPYLHGKTVAWFVYVGNDLDDNLRPELFGHRSPFVRRDQNSGEWEIFEGHVSPDPWPFDSGPANYERFVEICRDSHLSRRVFSACGYLLERGRDVCRETGARLVVMTVPELSPLPLGQVEQVLARRGGREDFDRRLPDRRLAEICARLQIPFVALEDHLQPLDYLMHDVHWSKRGHRRVADVLREVHTKLAARTPYADEAGAEKRGPASAPRFVATAPAPEAQR